MRHQTDGAVGLASHWPCGTDFIVVYPPIRADGQGKGDEHPTYAHSGMVRFSFLFEYSLFTKQISKKF